MQIKLILVGKTAEPYIKEGLTIYERRLTHYVPFEIVVLDELKKSNKTPDIDFQKQKEGEGIMKMIKPSDYVILLDQKGKEYSSVQLAQVMQKLMGTLQSNLVFVIGGAHGFDKKIYQRANMLLSLSKMTFSHQMVRLFFLEQIYRAMTIIRNEPYHHE